MFLTILIVLLLVVGVVTLVAARSPKTAPKSKKSIVGAGWVIILVAVVVTVLASSTIVQPREVGVKVALGKPTAVIGNGFHLKAPWEKVEKLDGAVQNDVYSGESSAIAVRLGNNGKADVDASIQWQLKSDDAMAVFLDYRTFKGIQSNLVDRNFRAALNEVMADYDPLVYVDPAEGGQDLESLANAVKTKMQGKVGEQIDIRSVTLPIINFDESTQTRINELQAETAKTRVAQQKKETSTAEAQANKILEQSITAETLTSKCLDIVAESGQSPIGCFPGSSVQPITMVGGDESSK